MPRTGDPQHGRLVVEILHHYSKFSSRYRRWESVLAEAEAMSAGGGRADEVVDRPRRQAQRRLDEQERARLVERYVAGASANEMARRFGVHKETVYGIVDAAGVRRRAKRKLTAGDEIEAQQLRAEGWSYQALGQHFGVAPETIRRRLAL